MWNKTAFLQLSTYKLCLPGLKVVLRTKELQQMQTAPSFVLYSFIRPGSMCCLFINIYSTNWKEFLRKQSSSQVPISFFSIFFPIYRICWQSRHVLREIALAQFEKFHFILFRRLGRSPDLNRFQGLAINTEGVERNVTAIWQTKKYLYACSLKKLYLYRPKLASLNMALGAAVGSRAGGRKVIFASPIM